jgi:hypothetical protein
VHIQAQVQLLLVSGAAKKNINNKVLGQRTQHFSSLEVEG